MKTVRRATRRYPNGRVSMLPEEGVQLEIDPDPELEREAEETAQRVMAGGKLGIQKLSDSEVHVQRYPGQERVEAAREAAADRVSSDDSQTVPADPKILVKEVTQIKNRQEEMYSAFVQASPGVNEFDGGRKMMLGAAGSLAGAGAGALLGSVVPVAGTTMGAAAGAAVGGAASDLTKETLGWLTDNSPDGASTEMHQRIRKLEAELEAMKRGTEYGGNDISGIR